eukprot:sb/3461847/
MLFCVLLCTLLSASWCAELNLPTAIVKRNINKRDDNICVQEVRRSEEYEDIEVRSLKTLVIERCAGENPGETYPCRRVKRSEVQVPVTKTREVVEMVENCCAGWEKDSDGKCAIPVCEGGCGSGECVAPATCSCDSGYEGTKCQRKKRSATVMVNKEKEEKAVRLLERSIARNKRHISARTRRAIAPTEGDAANDLTVAVINKRDDNICVQEVRRSEEYEDIEVRSLKTLVIERCAGENPGETYPCRRVKRSEVQVPVTKTREVVEMVENCCAGWEKDSDGKCAIPVCEGGCGSGECVAPATCSCDSGYEGTKCQRKKRSATVMVNKEKEEKAVRLLERSIARNKRHISARTRRAIAPTEGDGVCSVVGVGFFETFDGAGYQAKGTCQYVLARDCSSSASFSIRVTLENDGGEDVGVSSVEIVYGDNTVTLSTALSNSLPLSLTRRSEVQVPVTKTREVVEMVENCCAGWEKDSDGKCAIPVCEGGCGSGECVAPATCSCDSGYEGTKCQRKKRSATVMVNKEKEEKAVRLLERSIARNKRHISARTRRAIAPTEGDECVTGTTSTVGCTSCECNNSTWSCVDLECDGVCSVVGVGFFETFDGAGYQAKGTCQYVLARDCSSSASFSIRVTLENDGGEDVGVSSVEIVYGDNTVTLSTGSSVHANGEAAVLPVSVGSIALLSSGFFTVASTAEFTVRWDNVGTVYVDVASDMESNLCGLCGDFDKNPDNDMRNTLGSVITDTDTLLAAWQVDAQCDSVSFSNETTCDAATQAIADTDCDIINDFTDRCPDDMNFYAKCVESTCQCQSEDTSTCTCNILSAYFMRCSQEYGENLDSEWRPSSVCTGYPEECPVGTEYNSCGSACVSTCQNYFTDTECTLPCVEGCFCPENQVFVVRIFLSCVILKAW